MSLFLLTFILTLYKQIFWDSGGSECINLRFMLYLYPRIFVYFPLIVKENLSDFKVIKIPNQTII
jgi:hypothetical protein